MFRLADAEGEGEMVLDAKAAVGEMTRLWHGRRRELQRVFRRLGLGLIEVEARETYVKELLKFFRMRSKR